MEINLKQLSTQAVESSAGSTNMRLSENAASMVFQMFTKNIYSNPIGTVVREITSNCFDSHVEAGIKAPVVIKKTLDNQTNTHYISFIDYGVGMSPDRVENIYGVYFESTKRADNTQIGGFGIGGKTPLAYKRATGHGQGEYDNSFYVITVFDKVKYYYSIYEGQESPVISLLHSEPTTEHNGTEVRIPVLEKDLSTFSKEMVRQLYYFENVIFEGFDDSYNADTLTNEYQILRGKSFLFRGKDYSNNIHVCLGRVAYPIDYNVLGLNSSDYYLPIALKLEVGDINVVASREQLDYNEQTIKVLKKKLEEAKAEIISMLVKQYDNIVSLKDFFNFQNEFGTLTFPNGVSLNVGSLVKKKDVDLTNFKYNFLAMPNDKQLFNFFFEIKKLGKKGKSRYSYRNDFNGGYSEIKSTEGVYYVENEFVRKVAKASYLKDQHSTYYIVSRRNLAHNAMRFEIAELFNVHLDKLVEDNGKVIDYVQNLIEMQAEYFDIVREFASDYDSIEVPAEYLVRKKRNVLSPELRNTTIPAKLFGGYYGKTRIKLDSLFKFKEPIFYGTQDDETELLKAHRMFNALFNSDMVIGRYDEYKNEFRRDTKGGIMFIMLSKGNVKYMEHCKKAYPVKEFYNKMLYRKIDEVLTYFQTHEIVSQHNDIKDLYVDNNFSKINTKWGKVIKEVNAFIKNLPASKKDFSNIKSDLSRYIDLTNVRRTDEQNKILKKINELKALERKNTKVLEYINTWHQSLSDDIYVDILKKVMTF